VQVLTALLLAAADLPPRIANARIAQPLVLLHGLCGMALVGASTHHAVVAAGYLRGVYRVRLARVYALVTAIGWLVTFGLGALAYPTYRYFVRGLYLDWHRVWAGNLFDIKENFAALGLPIALVLLLLSRRLEPSEDPLLVGPYVALVFVLGAIAWFAAVAGMIVTLQRGVPV
jgi:hypothetical protein